MKISEPLAINNLTEQTEEVVAGFQPYKTIETGLFTIAESEGKPHLNTVSNQGKRK